MPNPIAQGSGCFGCGQASLGGITAGSDGNLWFVDGGRYKVGRMTPSGSLTEFDLPAIVGGPFGITLGPDGNIWITTNALGQGRPDWIVRLGRDGAVAQFQAGVGIGVSGTSPQGITSGPDGNLWFTETSADRIGRLTPAGVLTEFPTRTTPSSPNGIVAGPDGNLWFVESHYRNTAVARITTAGVITEYPLGGSPDDQLQPTEIVAGLDGNLWLSQSHPSAPQGEIVRVAPNGTFVTFPLQKGSRPLGLATGPDGNIWFTDWSGNAIGRMSPSGAVREFPLPRRNSQPSGITAGPGGRMWFTEGGRIASIGLTVPETTLNSRVVNFSSASASAAQIVTATNTGDAPLRVVAATLTGPDQGSFQVTRDTCSGRTVAVQAHCDVSVALVPGAGLAAALLQIVDNATGSPHFISLVARLPDCRLPLFGPSPAQGQFLNIAGGQVTDDPRGGFVTDGTGSRSLESPVLNGEPQASYDRPAQRWVPSAPTAVSPDGSRYAYIDYHVPFHLDLHVVEVATGRDRTLALPTGPWSLLAFTSDGIYLHAAYEGIGPGLTLVDPDSGVVTTAFSDSVVYLVSGNVAWIGARNDADPLPPPPSMGVSYNEIQRRDLSTSQTTTWFYSPGSNLYAVTAANGSILVSGSNGSATNLWAVTGPGQAVPITVPGSVDAVPNTNGLVYDANGWWIGSLDGVYLWTQRTGAVLVSESLGAPAGACA